MQSGEFMAILTTGVDVASAPAAQVFVPSALLPLQVTKAYVGSYAQGSYPNPLVRVTVATVDLPFIAEPYDAVSQRLSQQLRQKYGVTRTPPLVSLLASVSTGMHPALVVMVVLLSLLCVFGCGFCMFKTFSVDIVKV